MQLLGLQKQTTPAPGPLPSTQGLVTFDLHFSGMRLYETLVDSEKASQRVCCEWAFALNLDFVDRTYYQQQLQVGFMLHPLKANVARALDDKVFHCPLVCC